MEPTLFCDGQVDVLQTAVIFALFWKSVSAHGIWENLIVLKKWNFRNIFEPVFVKTGLNDTEMKIQITALRESINFSECFLKI